MNENVLAGCNLNCTEDTVQREFMSTDPQACIHCPNLVQDGEIYTCKYIIEIFRGRGGVL